MPDTLKFTQYRFKRKKTKITLYRTFAIMPTCLEILNALFLIQSSSAITQILKPSKYLVDAEDAKEFLFVNNLSPVPDSASLSKHHRKSQEQPQKQPNPQLLNDKNRRHRNLYNYFTFGWDKLKNQKQSKNSPDSQNKKFLDLDYAETDVEHQNTVAKLGSQGGIFNIFGSGIFSNLETLEEIDVSGDMTPESTTLADNLMPAEFGNIGNLPNQLPTTSVTTTTQAVTIAPAQTTETTKPAVTTTSARITTTTSKPTLAPVRSTTASTTTTKIPKLQPDTQTRDFMFDSFFETSFDFLPTKSNHLQEITSEISLDQLVKNFEFTGGDRQKNNDVRTKSGQIRPTEPTFDFSATTEDFFIGLPGEYNLFEKKQPVQNLAGNLEIFGRSDIDYGTTKSSFLQPIFEATTQVKEPIATTVKAETTASRTTETVPTTTHMPPTTVEVTKAMTTEKIMAQAGDLPTTTKTTTLPNSTTFESPKTEETSTTAAETTIATQEVTAAMATELQPEPTTQPSTSSSTTENDNKAITETTTVPPIFSTTPLSAVTTLPTSIVPEISSTTLPRTTTQVETTTSTTTTVEPTTSFIARTTPADNLIEMTTQLENFDFNFLDIQNTEQPTKSVDQKLEALSELLNLETMSFEDDTRKVTTKNQATTLELPTSSTIPVSISTQRKNNTTEKIQLNPIKNTKTTTNHVPTTNPTTTPFILKTQTQNWNQILDQDSDFYDDILQNYENYQTTTRGMDNFEFPEFNEFFQTTASIQLEPMDVNQPTDSSKINLQNLENMQNILDSLPENLKIMIDESQKILNLATGNAVTTTLATIIKKPKIDDTPTTSPNSLVNNSDTLISHTTPSNNYKFISFDSDTGEYVVDDFDFVTTEAAEQFEIQSTDILVTRVP